MADDNGLEFYVVHKHWKSKVLLSTDGLARFSSPRWLTPYTQDDEGVIFHWREYGDERFIRIGSFLTIPEVLDGIQWRNLQACDEEYLGSRLQKSVIKLSERTRKNLLVIRCGGDIEPLKWIDYTAPRDFDVMLSGYSDDMVSYKDRVEHLVLGGQTKLESIKDVFEKNRFNLNYKNFCVMDGDIRMGGNAALDNLFREAEYLKIDLAQPSLTHDSHYSHIETLQCPSFICRYTNFVEVMTPLFSEHAFWTLLPTFSASISTWGIDYLWPKIIGAMKNRVAIIDSISVVHSKPIDMNKGALYSHLRRIGIDPAVESNRLVSQFQVDTKIRIEGALTRDGKLLTNI